MGEKLRGARTAGAALNPGLNAEAADSIAASTTNIAAAADTFPPTKNSYPRAVPALLRSAPAGGSPHHTLRKEGLFERLLGSRRKPRAQLYAHHWPARLTVTHMTHAHLL